MKIEWEKSQLVVGSDTTLWKLSGEEIPARCGFDTTLWKLSGKNPSSLRVLTPHFGNRVGEIPSRYGFRHHAMETVVASK